jgi:diguanylate cyclase (GGDEF)-like protein/PAS domain S-box-containing protein
MAGYIAWMTILAGAVYAVRPLDWNGVLWGVMGLSSAAAILIGVRWHRPRRAAPWWLLMAGVLIFTAGDVAYGLVASRHQDAFPSIADGFYLVMYPVVAAGLLGLARSGAASRDRAGMLDGLILTAGLALLSWVLLVSPAAAVPGTSEAEKLILAAYPLADVLLLATATRLVTAARRTPVVYLLLLGAAATLVADALYGLTVADNTWRAGGPIDLGWIVFYVAWGAAGLHPSMAGMTEPAVLRRYEVSPRRLVLLTLSSLIPSAALLVEALAGRVRDGAVIAVLSALMFLLVLGRLANAVGIHHQSVARERGLRKAGAALVSAADASEVATAVRVAVGQLLPPDAAHKVVFAVNDPVPGVAIPVAGAVRIAQLRYVRTLDAPAAAELAGFEVAMLCPLTLAECPSGTRRAATLIVAAEESVLVALQDSLDVLAGQAALALERVTLNSEINRRASEEYFRTLVHTTSDVILIVNDDDMIRYASPSAASVLGAEPVIGARLHEVIHCEDQAQVDRVLELVRCDGIQVHGDWADWNLCRPDGSPVQVEVTCRDLRQDRTVGGLVITLRDVTERRRLENELRHHAFHDALTGLANRLLFQERVEQAMARSREKAGTVGVLFVDIDDFKLVNDTMGHATGDELLIAVGQRLSAALRRQDTAARLGGDEFAALIEVAGSPSDVEHVAERVVAALAEPFEIGERLVSGVASVGVATSEEATEAQELLRQADLALYVAKGAGKGRWRRYQPAQHLAIVQRVQLRAALDLAVAEGAFALEYQPIIDLSTGATAGFEALVRWNHPVRGLVAPGEFIEVAEETGLIEPIGDWVLEHAVAAGAHWHRNLAVLKGAYFPYVSINVSVRQFRTSGFVEKVRKELAAAGLPPRLLLLEITESLLLRDDEQVWADLTGLRNLGVRTAIDDFGTGYSSLSYLRQTPIDVLKIDRSFTDTISSSGRQRALVDGIVQLARTLGLQVIAEGIETSAVRDLLKQIGCPYGQGYLFSQPLKFADTVRRVLAERGTSATTAPAAV